MINKYIRHYTGFKGRSVQTIFKTLEKTIEPKKVDEFKILIKEIYLKLEKEVNKLSLMEILSNPKRVLVTKDTYEKSEPEPFTRKYIVDPILEFLGFGDFITETTQIVTNGERSADYTLKVGGERILVEAEPLNKNLRQKNTGINQVRTWLMSRASKTDFGIATNGFCWVLLKLDSDTYKLKELVTLDLRPLFLKSSKQKILAIEEYDRNLDEFVRDFYISFSKEYIIQTLKDITVILDRKIEIITENFYNEYIEFCFGVKKRKQKIVKTYCLMDAINTTKKVEENKARVFTVNFMNRLIFIKFLEDRNIVQNRLLLNLQKDYKKLEEIPTSFYKTYLEPLFFNVFNTPKELRKQDIKKNERFRNIPYLNGGLFRDVFEGSSISEFEFDIEDDILIKIISEFLEKYDFTLGSGNESLNPDILGKVFERTINFLTGGETNEQKSKGAYYTPDSITSYISKNTLFPIIFMKFKEHLLNQGWEMEELEKYSDLEDFLLRFPISRKKDLNAFIEIIDDIKILDPACGSGHFLSSALELLLSIKERLLIINNARYNLYDLKMDSIKNSLFGVDIERPAVEIAKLRLWLSLIENLDISDPTHITRLPNIEYNIMEGNTLFGWLDEKLYQKTIKYDKEEEKINKIIISLKEYFSMDKISYNKILLAEEKIQSYNLKEIITGYSYLKSIYVTTEGEKAVHLKRLLENVGESIDKFVTPQYYKYLVDISKKWGNNYKLSNKKLKSSNIVPFHWNLHFNEAMTKGGFDVIIGNPPYVTKELSKSEKEVYNSIYRDSVSDRPNLYNYFLNRLSNLINENGLFSFIISNSFITDRFSNKLRDFIIKTYRIEYMLDFLSRRNIFKGTLQGTCIFIFHKLTEINLNNYEIGIGQTFDSHTLTKGDIINGVTTKKELIGSRTNIFLLSPYRKTYKIFRDVEQSTTTLDKIAKTIQSGEIRPADKNCRPYFIKGKRKRGAFPVITGKNLNCFTIDIGANRKDARWYIRPSEEKNRLSRDLHSKYPRIVLQRITAREQTRRLCAGIISKEDINRSKRVWVENSGANYILLIDDKYDFTYDPNLILGLINSIFINWYMHHINLTAAISPSDINSIPIPSVKSKKREITKIIKLVNRIRLEALHLESTEDILNHLYPTNDEITKITKWMDEIDNLIFEIFDIKEKDRKFIRKSMKKHYQLFKTV